MVAVAVRSGGWCIKLWDVTSLGSVQVVGFFDVAARLSAGDGPIAALVGGSSCSIHSAVQQRTFNDYENITVGQKTSKNKHQRRKTRRYCPITFMKAEKNAISIIATRNSITEYHAYMHIIVNEY